MDWNKISEEAVRYLQQYIRINTVNPPGNEMEAVRFFKKIFDSESIPTQVFEPLPGRGNIIATLKGSGKKKPILLLSHMDVVPVDKDQWEVDPFGGIIKDGYLYGRGALDDKSMGIMEMMVLLVLKREKITLDRDILFYASADEETGGKWGVEWAVQSIPILKEPEYAFNEGGYVILNGAGQADRYEISNGQKVIFQLVVKAKGIPGHGSQPHPDNPNVKLVHALERLTQWETPFHILPMVKEYFLKMAPRQPVDKRKYFEDIEKGLRDPAFAKWLTSNIIYNSIVRNTISLTILKAGSKENVIPSEASATLDCRLVPGESKENFLREVQARLGKEIQVELLSESNSLPPSPFDTDLYRAIQKIAEKNDPGAPVVPLLLTGATDGRFLRENGAITYDFCPFRLPEEELHRVHGNNERIAVDNLGFGIRTMVDILKEEAT